MNTAVEYLGTKRCVGLKSSIDLGWGKMAVGKLEKIVLSIIAAIVAISVFIFYRYYNLTLIDSVYFVITTLTTVGYGDITLLNAPAPVKVYGIFLLFVGAASLAVLFSMITDYVVTLKFNKFFGRGGTKMKNHVLLVGWNKTAEAALDEIRKVDKAVVLTRKENAVKEIHHKNVDVVIGDGTDDKALKRANIGKAKTVITADEDDSKNIMTTIIIKKLNPKVKIISSANEVANMKLLKDAGADEVISPDVIGGRLLTSAIFEQNVVELIKDATYVGEGTNLEEIKPRRPVYVEDLMNKFRISVLEVVKDGERISDLYTDYEIVPGDTAIVFGLIDNIEKAKRKVE